MYAFTKILLNGARLFDILQENNQNPDQGGWMPWEKEFESLDSGGMGLGMIAQIASAIHYERKNGRNVNTLFFSLQNDTTHLTS